MKNRTLLIAVATLTLATPFLFGFADEAKKPKPETLTIQLQIASQPGKIEAMPKVTVEVGKEGTVSLQSENIMRKTERGGRIKRIKVIKSTKYTTKVIKREGNFYLIDLAIVDESAGRGGWKLNAQAYIKPGHPNTILASGGSFQKSITIKASK